VPGTTNRGVYTARMDALKVLFICIGNSCRSPMAEAMTRTLSRGRVSAYSAGLAPIDHISAGTLDALARLGYSGDDLSAKGLEDVPLSDMDVIVSMVGTQGLRHLPVNLPARRVVWSIRDPFGEDDEVFLAVARLIERRVRALLTELAAAELRHV